MNKNLLYVHKNTFGVCKRNFCIQISSTCTRITFRACKRNFCIQKSYMCTRNTLFTCKKKFCSENSFTCTWNKLLVCIRKLCEQISFYYKQNQSKKHSIVFVCIKKSGKWAVWKVIPTLFIYSFYCWKWSLKKYNKLRNLGR